MDLSNNSERLSTNSFSDSVANNVERSVQPRQKLCSPKFSRDDEYEQTQPKFGNIYSGPLSATHGCVSVN